MTKTTKNTPPIAPATMSVRALADLLMLTPRRVQQLAAEGVIPAATDGLYSVPDAVRGYSRWLQDAPQRAPQGREAARALTQARTRMIEAQIAREAARLVPAAEVLAYTYWFCGTLIDRIRELPGRLGMAEGDAIRTQAAIDRIAREVTEKMRSARFGARS